MTGLAIFWFIMGAISTVLVAALLEDSKLSLSDQKILLFITFLGGPIGTCLLLVFTVFLMILMIVAVLVEPFERFFK